MGIGLGLPLLALNFWKRLVPLCLAVGKAS